MYDDPGYYDPKLKEAYAEINKLREALQALLATLPTCTFTDHNEETGVDTDCKEYATATLDGPHDQSWEMCVAHATQVKNEQPHPHRYQINARDDLVAAVAMAKETLK
jgi:hypothetical protein